MNYVFIGGSRSVSRLHRLILERLDQPMSSKVRIFIGDANGADKAAQRYFACKGYDDVEVFCAGSTCRNNIGGWPVRHVGEDARHKRYDFYGRKDQVMANEATEGLMIWDGDSFGTLMNVWRLFRQGKPVSVFNVRASKWIEIHDDDAWLSLVAMSGPNARARFDSMIALERGQEPGAAQRSFFDFGI